MKLFLCFQEVIFNSTTHLRYGNLIDNLNKTIIGHTYFCSHSQHVYSCTHIEVSFYLVNAFQLLLAFTCDLLLIVLDYSF